MKTIFNLFDLSFLKYLISFDFKALFYLLYNFFYSIFFTKSSFLFGFNVGWNINFLNIFNFIKMIVIFIWEKLTTLIYPLKLFSFLFDFLIEGIKIFISINKKLLELLQHFFPLLEVVTKLTLGSLAAVVSTVGLTKIFATLGSAIPVIGPSVKAFCDELSKKTYVMLNHTINIFSKIIAFIFNIFVLVINGLFKIVLRILDIMVIVLNIWLLLLKKVIIILGFIFSFFMNFIFLWVYDSKNLMMRSFKWKEKYLIIIPFIIIATATLLFLVFWIGGMAYKYHLETEERRITLNKDISEEAKKLNSALHEENIKLKQENDHLKSAPYELKRNNGEIEYYNLFTHKLVKKIDLDDNIYEYDKNNGLLLKKEDKYKNIYEYGTHGKLIKKTLPDGVWMEYNPVNEKLIKRKNIDGSIEEFDTNEEKFKETDKNGKIKYFKTQIYQTVADFKKLGVDSYKLKSSGFTVKELRDTGYTAKELRDALFTLRELRDGGFTAKDLKKYDYSAYDLSYGRFSAKELRDAGYTDKEIFDAPFTLQELRDAGYTIKEIQKFRYVIVSSLILAGYTDKEILDAGYSADELRSARKNK